MSEPILHHYDVSPYAEKVRLMFGLKGLAWKSVQIPMIMPKPDLTCLTGGYRKTPVLQVGADVYCDTKTIARALERLAPDPTLYPANTEATERGLSLVADTMFMAGVVALLGEGLFPQDFVEDRQKMIPGGFDPATAKRAVPAKLDQLRGYLAALDAQLADGRDYLLADEVSLADLSVYNPVSFLAMAPITAGLATGLAHLDAWRGRIASIGHGERVEIDSTEAIETARNAEPATETAVDPGEPNGYRAGDTITVMPEDYGMDPVTGTLVYSDPWEIAVRRHDDRVGDVVVHFPRQGYLTFRAG